ncbi:Indigoidine synthase A like protein-domain-containing protein [Piptocephalis cylindrospora]|uniref:Indigoidine synthase A like protein-domain-containing protein n=1 Tax=Piptocephalis cylindrospora TaxID=1907219 RepID=A0A4P9Y7C9_9FUNG|nr:Indigoidine synthase A like protein-domain-containing protein [Piptocephalis cylindrospora]|eukprot:RKP14945.1 Indigoidine synthase A like protein-domain-containing protein [Piptocephalis cylindrospora]
MLSFLRHAHGPVGHARLSVPISLSSSFSTARAILVGRSIGRRYQHGWTPHPHFIYSPEVKAALEADKPVVALESTIITHGMPFPQNVQTSNEVEEIIREAGVTPATIAILSGKVHIGLSSSEVQGLGQRGKAATKTSRRDISLLCAQGKDGATTVSGTMVLAHRAGIPIFATGGIGGVHREGESNMDVSADLTELGRTPVAVVCAGAKSILDIGRTLEYLETQGVSVVTVGGSKDFPAFFTRSSGFQSPSTCQDPEEAAKMIMENEVMGLGSGMVFAVPIPQEDEAAGGGKVQAAIDQALQEAKDKGIQGSSITPFLLDRVTSLTKGESLRANIALIKNNARVGASIALARSKNRQAHPVPSPGGKGMLPQPSSPRARTNEKVNRVRKRSAVFSILILSF